MPKQYNHDTGEYEEIPVDVMHIFDELKDNVSPDAATAHHDSYQMATDPGFVAYLKSKGLDSGGPKARVIGDPSINKAASVYSSPGSEWARGFDDLMKGGSELPMSQEQTQLPEPNMSVGQPGGRDLPVLADVPDSHKDIDRSKEEFKPNSPLHKKDDFGDQDFVNYLGDYQQKANDARLIAGLGEASTTIGTQGRASKEDLGFFRNIAENADKPLKEAMGASKLNDQLLESKEKRKLLQEAADPNSMTSQNTRDAWMLAVPDIETKMPNFKSLSAVQLKEYVDDPLKAQMLQLSKEQMLAIQTGLGYAKLGQQSLENKANRESKEGMNTENNQTKITTAGMKPGAGKGKPLPEKIGNTITTYDSAISLINKINGHLDKTEPGRVNSVRNTMAQWFNVDDPETSEFRSLVGDQLSKIILEISGRASTDAERSFLKANNPSDTDKPETFKRKMHNLYDYVSGKRNSYVKNQAAGKYDMSDFGDTEGYREPPGKSNIVTLRKGGKQVSFDVSDPQHAKEMEEAKTEGWK